MSKTIKKCAAMFIAASLLIWLCVAACISPAFAVGRGEVILSCRSDGAAITGMTWNIYKVGELDTQSSSVSFKAYAPFDRYYVRINDLSANNLTDMASTLENLAILDKVLPLDTGVSDSNGEIYFGDLEPGLYLISGKYLKLDGGYRSYRPAPSLVEITDAGETLHIDAKITPLLTLAGEITAHTVKKIWENDIEEIRPESVTVEIYMDGELVETIELNKSNNWTYRWTTDVYADWRVRETDYFDNYTVRYRNNDANMGDYQYAIINTYDEDGDDVPKVTTTPGTPTVTTTVTTRIGPVEGDDNTRTSSSSEITVAGSGDDTEKSTGKTTAKTTVTSPAAVTTTENKLPQTGQLWWPIPVLVFGGLIFVAVGVRMRSRNKE